MNKNKIKIYKFLKRFLSAEFIQTSLLLIVISVVFIIQIKNKTFAIENFIETNILLAVIVTVLSKILASATSKLVDRKYEDCIKLTENYNHLLKKYSRAKCYRVSIDEKVFEVPAVYIYHRNHKDIPYDFNFNKREGKYELPTQIKEYSHELMRAHSRSFIYNSLVVRVEDIIKEKNSNLIQIDYCETAYFDSLITNRAMDYLLSNGKTVRDIYEPGPFISDLKKSKLSNHLGFNGFIETSDGKIIIVKRGNDLSIGKNTWGTSVATAFEAEYGFDDNREITEKTFLYTIEKRIHDELGIEVSNRSLLKDGVFCFYRDLVEGGKPQFLFYYKEEKISSEEHRQNFFKHSKKDAMYKMRVDGEKIDYIDVHNIFEGSYLRTFFKEKNMMPSMQFSFLALVEYLKED